MKTRLHLRLEAKAAEVRKIAVESILNGLCDDFAQYKYWTGYLKGIDDVIALLDSIEREDSDGFHSNRQENSRS